MSRAEKNFVSLKVKMLAAVLFSLCAAMCMYMLVFFVGSTLVKQVYLSTDRVHERAEKAFLEFEAFVTQNNIRSDDIEAVKRWCAGEKFVFVSVYDDSRLLYETDGDITEMGSASSLGAVTNSALNSVVSYRRIRFSDGAFHVNVIEYTEARFTDIMAWVSVICAVVIMFASLLYFTGRVVSRISSLSRKLSEVGEDGSHAPIVYNGNDELSRLAQSAERMRKNIVSHYENEQRAYKANTELMTALSHDIRTPLTSLLLYTDALSNGKVEESEDVKKYASVCYEKATQLKNLTDTMFRYFLLYTDNISRPVLQKYDASQLLSQLVYEYDFALEQKGYNISFSGLDKECSIKTDASVIKRVFDNVFSNLEKYADKEKPITVTVSEDETHIRISVINYISQTKPNSESNRIGLRSCKKIMSLVQGSFEYGNNGNLFEALIIIPKSDV